MFFFVYCSNGCDRLRQQIGTALPCRENVVFHRMFYGSFGIKDIRLTGALTKLYPKLPDFYFIIGCSLCPSGFQCGKGGITSNPAWQESFLGATVDYCFRLP